MKHILHAERFQCRHFRYFTLSIEILLSLASQEGQKSPDSISLWPAIHLFFSIQPYKVFPEQRRGMVVWSLKYLLLLFILLAAKKSSFFPFQPSSTLLFHISCLLENLSEGLGGPPLLYPLTFYSASYLTHAEGR